MAEALWIFLISLMPAQFWKDKFQRRPRQSGGHALPYRQRPQESSPFSTFEVERRCASLWKQKIRCFDACWVLLLVLNPRILLKSPNQVSCSSSELATNTIVLCVNLVLQHGLWEEVTLLFRIPHEVSSFPTPFSKFLRQVAPNENLIALSVYNN